MLVEGRYHLENRAFIANGRKFLLRKRKEPKNKPELFLVALHPFAYVSSLFPTEDEGEYVLDYQSEVYRLRLAGDSVELEKSVH